MKSVDLRYIGHYGAQSLHLRCGLTRPPIWLRITSYTAYICSTLLARLCVGGICTLWLTRPLLGALILFPFRWGGLTSRNNLDRRAIQTLTKDNQDQPVTRAMSNLNETILGIIVLLVIKL